MGRDEAEKLYDSGKEPTVEKLLEQDAENRQLKEKVAQLQRNSQESSKPPSSDNPKDRNQKDEKQSKSKRKADGQPGHNRRQL